jgi:hypothetical protein
MNEHVDTAAEEQAAAIAKGEAEFATEREVTVIGADSLMRIVIVLAVISIVSTACLLAFSIYRGQERRTYNSSLNELTTDLDIARQQRDTIKSLLDQTNAGIECRAQSQLDLDKAQADTLLVIARQFAAAVDQVPPPADPAVVNASAAELDKALVARQVAIDRCASLTPEPPPGTVP